MDRRRLRLGCSLLALVLAALLLVVLAAHVREPLRAGAVVAFLAAPALLGERFVALPGALENLVVALACGLVTIAAATGVTFAAASWTPRAALAVLAALVALVALVDLLRAALRRGPGVP